MVNPTSMKKKIPPITPPAIAPAFDFFSSAGSEKTKICLLSKTLLQISYLIKGLRIYLTLQNYEIINNNCFAVLCWSLISVVPELISF